MIETQDVRSGNHVLLNTSGLAVTILKVEDNSVLLETFPQNSSILKTDISGIPLTITMLRNLNFNNDKESSTWYGQGINIHIKPDGFFYGLRITRTRAKIQYLHQLQNYLSDFFLTFKEVNRSLDFTGSAII